MYSIFLAQGPADTLDYFIAGYAVFFTVMTLYLVSLFLRGRNLQRDYEMLQELEKQKDPLNSHLATRIR